MSQPKKGVASDGKVPNLKVGAADANDSMSYLLAMKVILIEKMEKEGLKIINRMDRIDNSIHIMLEAVEQQRCSGLARIQEKEARTTQRHGASKYGVIRNAPRRANHTRYLGPAEGQQGTCYHKEEQDPLPASRPGSRIETKSNPGGELRDASPLIISFTKKLQI